MFCQCTNINGELLRFQQEMLFAFIYQNPFKIMVRSKQKMEPLHSSLSLYFINKYSCYIIKILHSSSLRLKDVSISTSSTVNVVITVFSAFSSYVLWNWYHLHHPCTNSLSPFLFHVHRHLHIRATIYIASFSSLLLTSLSSLCCRLFRLLYTISTPLSMFPHSAISIPASSLDGSLHIILSSYIYFENVTFYDVSYVSLIFVVQLSPKLLFCE